MEEAFAAEPPPTSAAQGASVFQRVLSDAAKHSIPSGRRPNFIPGIPREVITLREESDRLRARDPASPDIDRLSQEINSRLW